jgi:ADP-ribose pyrophosphatase YjhB (NUDIX family)
MSELLEEIKRLKSISEIGSLYSSNEYDKERYKELHEIAIKLLNKISGQSVDDLKINLPLATDYPTAKVDIRGMVLSEDNKILFVKESADEKWSLPGGWADVGYSAKEVIVKEFKEETGLHIVPERLLAVFDKKMHAHPPQPFYVYKMAFYCKATSREITKGFDVLDVQYFTIDNLLELSENRILKSQVELLYKKIMDGDLETYVD